MSQLDLIKILNVLSSEHKKKVFTLRDIASLLHLSRPAAAMQLLRAQKKGLVFRVKQIWINMLNPPDLLEVALALVSPSYLSLESALFYHQFISQSPKGGISLVTPGRPYKIVCPLGMIQYFHIQKKLFFGFDLMRRAYPEKALLDLIYFRGLKNRTHIFFEEIYMDRINKKKLFSFAKHYPSWVLDFLKKII
ncbi:MAG: hypothetical protein HYS98_07800 [Deltaproteobacteria bacterium]|nr:hypothetical protein [Deltaproteobacteria bacterium]